MDSLPFPMPGDDINARTVIASVEYFDDERGAVALVLLLDKEPPFYTLGYYALTDVDSDSALPQKQGSLDWIGEFENIVPAVEAYQQNGGDY